jgi:uncharacterized membrane protein YebE (DUF533 family)
MKVIHHLLVAASLGSAMAAVPVLAVAQPTPVIDQREANQNARIARGENTGQLSKREANRLQAGQAKVQGMETAAKADGKVTHSERAAIRAEQNHQSRRIARQKHDHNRR